MKLSFLRFVAAVCLLALARLPAGAEPAETAKEVNLTWGVKVPMRDDIQFNATLYRPKESKKALPVIFTMTPYISDNYHDRAMYFAQHDYNFALVDVRGARQFWRAVRAVCQR